MIQQNKNILLAFRADVSAYLHMQSDAYSGPH